MEDTTTTIINYSTRLKPVWSCTTAFMVYFGTRYVSNDIKTICGNAMDHYAVKIFTVFCIFYQASGNMYATLTFTLLFSLLQVYMKMYPECKSFKDTKYMKMYPECKSFKDTNSHNV